MRVCSVYLVRTFQGDPKSLVDFRFPEIDSLAELGKERFAGDRVCLTAAAVCSRDQETVL